jgi:hypothetical protein
MKYYHCKSLYERLLPLSHRRVPDADGVKIQFGRPLPLPANSEGPPLTPIHEKTKTNLIL